MQQVTHLVMGRSTNPWGTSPSRKLQSKEPGKRLDRGVGFFTASCMSWGRLTAASARPGVKGRTVPLNPICDIVLDADPARICRRSIPGDTDHVWSDEPTGAGPRRTTR